MVVLHGLVQLGDIQAQARNLALDSRNVLLKACNLTLHSYNLLMKAVYLTCNLLPKAVYLTSNLLPKLFNLPGQRLLDGGQLARELSVHIREHLFDAS